jgi:hypothetical protein
MIPEVNATWGMIDSYMIRKKQKILRMIIVYRGTEDGFTAESFHKKCDNIPNTMTFVKTDMENVFGGFASIPWQ